MWQICGHVPQSLLVLNDITFRAAQLSVSFFMETFIHAKEKVKSNVFGIIDWSLTVTLIFSQRWCYGSNY